MGIHSYLDGVDRPHLTQPFTKKSTVITYITVITVLFGVHSHVAATPAAKPSSFCLGGRLTSRNFEGQRTLR